MVGPCDLAQRHGRRVLRENVQAALGGGSIPTIPRRPLNPRALLPRGQLIEAQRHPLGRAAVVDEHDRRAVLTHQRQQLGINRRPDRIACGLPTPHGLQRIPRRRAAEVRHRLNRHLDAQIQRLAHTRVEDPHLPAWAHQKTAHLLQRALCRRQPHALHPVARALVRRGVRGCLGGARAEPRLLVQPLKRQRQVRPALHRRHGMDLIHDHRLNRAQHRARTRAEDQVQRLGGRDQDVRRVARHRRALGLGGVPRADTHTHLRPNPPQRRAQVALDVIRKRLQRRHIHHAHARGAILRARAQSVQRPQERRERLPRAGRRRQQHVLPTCDRRPRLCLRGGRLGKRRRKPVARRGAERQQRIQLGGRHV